ncbi:protein-export chaperone SecB [Altererythrobacter sp. H2]|uniref:protein-export chaperone SecB n=1 Tax=Altererythrobacter sp. H2 TaxID=3108391 RepID=UPI002B4BFC1E|nr:protein-export chaperone SecB [Altererythrobacter sp. H2]WRK95745.1 protein-export chaperone SecB [Altererythrobacter sp. H2]
MADEGDILTDINPDPLPNGADTTPAAGLISQYIKDLSVENPNAPQAYQWTEAPQIDLQLNIGAQPVSDEVHEVELKITVTAKAQQGNFYIVELAYCGLVGMRNLPDEQAHAFLYAEAPRILFPFARRIVADATRDLGYQPLLLDPIDFNGLYFQRIQEQAAAAGGAGAPAAEA